MNGLLFFLQKIKKSQSGWSVTELLVASTILVLMTAALSRVYINGQQAFMFLQNNMDNTQTARQTINLMSRDLRSTIEITAATDNSINYTGDYDGNGTNDNMAFTYTSGNRTLTRTLNSRTTTVSNGVVNAVGQPLFKYYNQDGDLIIDPSSYAESATRVKINLLIDNESNEKPDKPVELFTGVQLRNLHERR